MHSPHEINRPAAGFITRVPSALTPHPSRSTGLYQEPALPPAATTAPSPTGGRILVADTEFPYFLLLSWWPLGNPEDRVAILWPLSLLFPAWLSSLGRGGEALTLAYLLLILLAHLACGF